MEFFGLATKEMRILSISTDDKFLSCETINHPNILICRYYDSLVKFCQATETIYQLQDDLAIFSQICSRPRRVKRNDNLKSLISHFQLAIPIPLTASCVNVAAYAA